MRTWPEVERALQARPGWRRSGNEYHGPCPVTGAGTDCAWFGSGSGSGGVRGGCRHCGDASGGLGGEAWREHLAAVCGDDGPGRTARRAVGPSGARMLANLTREDAPCGDFSPSPDQNHVRAAETLSEAVWRSGVAADGTPGAVYLVRTRRVWPAGAALPASVRWLPADRTGSLRPSLPAGAAGALLYRFAAAEGKTATAALQVEAVTADGEAVAGPAGKRPSLAGADFGAGRRVFVARAADGGAGVHLCEGPLDALALVALERLGCVALGGAAVVAAAGTAGFKPAACAEVGPVTVWPDGDAAGEGAAARLAVQMPGRARVRWRAAGPGRDLADWAAEAALEREAIRNDG